MKHRDHLTSTLEGEVWVVTVRETKFVDETNIGELFTQLDAFLQENAPKKLVVDLSNVRYLSSGALGRLVKLERNLRANKAKLRLAGVKPELLEIFSVTRLDTLLTIHESAEEAVKAFQKRFGLF